MLDHQKPTFSPQFGRSNHEEIPEITLSELTRQIQYRWTLLNNDQQINLPLVPQALSMLTEWVAQKWHLQQPNQLIALINHARNVCKKAVNDRDINKVTREEAITEAIKQL